MINSWTSGHIDIAGFTIPNIFLIFAAAVLAFIVVVLIITACVSKNIKKKKRNQAVKQNTPRSTEQSAPDDGIFVNDKKFENKPTDKKNQENSIEKSEKAESYSNKSKNDEPSKNNTTPVKEETFTADVLSELPKDEPVQEDNYDVDLIDDDEDAYAVVKDENTNKILTFIDKQSNGEEYQETLVEEFSADSYSDDDIESVFLKGLQEDEVGADELDVDVPSIQETDVEEIVQQEEVVENLETIPEELTEDNSEDVENTETADEAEDDLDEVPENTYSQEVLDEVTDDTSENIRTDLADQNEAYLSADELDVDEFTETEDEIIHDNDEVEPLVNGQNDVLDEAAVDAIAGTAIVANSDDDDEDDDDEDGNGKLRVQSKYKRSFLSKLIQSDDVVKDYYSGIKNELLSYEKMRSSQSQGCESFNASRKNYAKIALSGKTLALYLNLNPSDFNPSSFHHKDKSDNKKYAQVPMMVKIKSDLGMRKAISLIMTMMGDNGVSKTQGFKPVDYKSQLPYRTDEELLVSGLIKYNMSALEDVSRDITEDDIKADNEYREKNNIYRTVAPIRKEKVGKTTQKDVNKAVAKSVLGGEVAEERNRSEKGKFVVSEENDEYSFTLYNPQGKDLFTSVSYKTLSSAANAIGEFVEASKDEYNFAFNSIDDKFIFVLRGKSTFASLPYPTKVSCVNAVSAIRAVAAEAEMVQRQVKE